MPPKKKRFDVGVLNGEGVSVKTSTIPNAGLGLFADRDFAKNEIITEYCGERIDRQEAERRRELKQQSHIISVIAMHEYIDGKHVRLTEKIGVASFVNDSRDPATTNAVRVVKFNPDTASHHVVYKANRHIRAGEEIFRDYERGYWLLAEEQASDPSKNS